MREAKLIAVIGKKGVGKSYLTNQIFHQYISGFNGLVKPRRVLIMDVNDEYNYPSIWADDVKRFNHHPVIEVRRVRPYNKDGSKMNLDEICATLNLIVNTYKGGLLLAEDINRYVSDNMPDDLIGTICTNRHADMDIIIHYQALGRITPKVWQNMNVLRFHKNTESVKRHEKKFSDKSEILQIAENIVNYQYNNGNPYYHVYVDVEEMKIKTPVDEATLNVAFDEYIIENMHNLKRRVVNEAQLKNEKINTADIVNRIKQRLKKDYI
jgi:predicted protein tyrosine phosphatase